METSRWSALVARIVPQDADDLDELTAPYDPRRRTRRGDAIFPTLEAAIRPEPAFKRRDLVCVGVRAPIRVPDAADRALRLASFAAERDVEIVILAECEATGFERFGFRVERIAAAAPGDETCAEQVRRFWGLDLML